MVKCYTFRVSWNDESKDVQFFEEYFGRMKRCNSDDFQLAFLSREKTPMVPVIKAGIKQYLKSCGVIVDVRFVSAIAFEELDCK